MRLDVYVPVVVSVLLGLGCRPVARNLPPRTALRLLLVAGTAAAVCWGWALALLGFTAVGQLSFVAREGHWSRAALRSADPVAGPVAWIAAVAFLLAVGTLVVVTLGRVRAVWVTHAMAGRVCRAHPTELVVVQDAAPHAFALPGRGGGRIVASASLLAALDPVERRALLAHERAHLSGRHHLCMIGAQLAAAADPLLVRLPHAVGYLIERCADEAAVVATGDRRTVARAICRAGLAALRAGSPARHPVGAALPFAASQVRARVIALLARPVPARPFLVAAVLGLLVLTAVAAVDAGGDVEHLVDLARNGYWATPFHRHH